MANLRSGRAILTIAAAIATLGLVLFIRAIPDTAPDSDFAVTDLRVLNVIRHLDPEGPYSRFGWDHPGPAYFQLLAPLYWLSGYRHVAILATVVLLNAGCIAGVLAIVWRLSRSSPLVLATSVVLGVYVWRAWGLLASAWTAHVTIVPLALLIVCAGAVACGRVWFLPAVVAIASFVVQTHIGAAASATAIAIAAIAGLFLSRGAARRAGRALDPIGRPFTISLALGVVLWALPLADALRPSGGHNAQQLYAFFSQARPVSARTTERAFAHYFVSPFGSTLQLPWGLALPELNEPLTRWLAFVEAAFVIAAGGVWLRRGRTFEGALALVVFAGAIAAFLSVRRLPEQPMDHTVYWVSILGAMCWAVISGLLLDVCIGRFPGPRALSPAIGRACVAMGTGLVVVCAVWQGAERHATDAQISTRMERLSHLVITALAERRVTDPLVVVTQDTWGTVSGVVLQLARAGLHVSVSADWTDMFGRRLLPTGREPVSVRLVSRSDQTRDFGGQATPRLIGTVDDFDVYLIDR